MPSLIQFSQTTKLIDASHTKEQLYYLFITKLLNISTLNNKTIQKDIKRKVKNTSLKRNKASHNQNPNNYKQHFESSILLLILWRIIPVCRPAMYWIRVPIPKLVIPTTESITSTWKPINLKTQHGKQPECPKPKTVTPSSPIHIVERI